MWIEDDTRKENKMKVLTTLKSINTKKYTYNLLGTSKKEPTHLHINNTQSSKDSVIVPLKALQELGLTFSEQGE
jgi:hypothetical protein|tara:strand:+ start:69 stop:290 length:222 start_codon:yes stop_codon:yes gene_type:complete